MGGSLKSDMMFGMYSRAEKDSREGQNCRIRLFLLGEGLLLEYLWNFVTCLEINVWRRLFGE